MPKGPIRRSQLIAPFGVGAMTVVRDGTSLICAGLDHWYAREEGDPRESRVEIEEYRVEEWRLARVLQVDHFRLPPDYREKQRWADAPNCGLTVPFLRFPQWHFCQNCKRLEMLPLTDRSRQVRCSDCQARNRTAFMAQVPFVAMCGQGHLQDFPWREWAHRTSTPACQRPMRLIATGAATLAGQKVVCECGMERSLSGITEARTEGNEVKTRLSEELDQAGAPYLCSGLRPWLGGIDHIVCGHAVRGSLRSAANVHFSQVRSAIYLPRGAEEGVAELVSIMEGPPLSTAIKLLKDHGVPVQPASLRGHYGSLLAL